MRDLDAIIANLTKEEVRNFKLFNKRTKYNISEKQSIVLFDAYRTNKYEDDNNIYEDKFTQLKKNAFYRLKNRLMDDVDKSLLLLNSNRDNYIEILNLVQLSRVFQFKVDYESAMDILLKAESRAVDNEFYSILILIYEEIIKLSQFFNNINPNEYIERKKNTIKKHAEIQEVDDLIAVVSYELKQSNFSGKDNDVISILTEINAKYESFEIIRQSTRARLKYHECIRNILLQIKDFSALKIFLTSQLEEMEKDNLFSKSFHQDKIKIIVWLINTQLKLKEFGAALNTSQELLDNLEKYNKLYFERYYWTYEQTISICNFYLGNLETSLEALHKMEKERHFKSLHYYTIFMHLNFSSVYYAMGNRDKAFDYLALLNTKDIFKKLSAELKLTVSIIELLMHYDSQDYSYVEYRIGEIKRTLKTLLRNGDFQVENEFLKLLKRLIKSQDSLSKGNLKAKCLEFISTSVTYEPGSNQTINYAVWLKAKLNNQTYYDTLMNTLHEID